MPTPKTPFSALIEKQANDCISSARGWFAAYTAMETIRAKLRCLDNIDHQLVMARRACEVGIRLGAPRRARKEVSRG